MILVENSLLNQKMARPNVAETASYDSSYDDEDERLLNPTNAAGRDEDWDEWQGDAADADEDVTKSLFGPEVLPNPEAAMDHDAAKYGFDIRQFAIQERLDEYGIIRVINYIRSEVAAGRDPLPALVTSSRAGAGTGSTAPWVDDRYLLPAMEDDALLFFDFEEVAAAAADVAAPGGASGEGAGSAPGASGGGGDRPMGQSAAADPAAAATECARLRAENEALWAALLAMRQEFLPEELREAADGERVDAAAPSTSTGTTTAAASGATRDVEPAGDPEPTAAAAIAADQARRVDAAYFDSYSYLDIHREMLGDKARTEAYRDALERNPRLLQGATVLDVGCGTGILSLFACRGGAARAVAVDGSERIAGFARRHAELAGFSDSCGGPMTVLSGKMEELGDRMPVKQVDVIVSEWMGYALLFETMLDTVLHARDVYLRPGGAVLPDRAAIYIAGARSAAGGLGFWSNVYGFDMSPVAAAISEAGKGQAVVMHVPQEHIITSTACVKELDLCTMRPEDQDFTAEFRLEPQSPSERAATSSTDSSTATASAGGGDGAAATIAGSPQEVGCIALWFDTTFSDRYCKEHPVTLSTSPFAPTTHWVQTLLTLRQPVLLAAAADCAVSGSGSASGNDGCRAAARAGGEGGAAGTGVARAITGRISLVRSREKHRSLDIALQYRAELSDGRVVDEAHLYHMSVMAPS